MKIRLFGMVRNSIVDGPGIRYTLFTQGCPHHCNHCHNPGSWDPTGGALYDIDWIVSEIIKDPLTSGVSLSGGEPFIQLEACNELLSQLQEKGGNKYDVYTWTGYRFEELVSDEKYSSILDKIDVIVDGVYINEMRNLKLKWRGSENQRLIDVKESLRLGNTTLVTDPRWI